MIYVGCCCHLITKLCHALVIVACQAPLSMGFPGQENWSGLPLLSPEDFLDPVVKHASPALQANSLSLNHKGNPIFWISTSY